MDAKLYCPTTQKSGINGVNYSRDISTVSCFGKKFTSVVNTRILEWDIKYMYGRVTVARSGIFHCMCNQNDIEKTFQFRSMDHLKNRYVAMEKRGEGVDVPLHRIMLRTSPPPPPVFRKMRFVQNIGTVEKIAFFYWSLINDLQHPNFPQKL